MALASILDCYALRAKTLPNFQTSVLEQPDKAR